MQVKNIQELKAAIDKKPKSIEITDPDLAKKVRIIKSASTPVLAGLIGATGITVAMAWNPIGWTTAGVGAIASGLTAAGATTVAESSLLIATAFFIATLGVGVLWALINEWEIETTIENSNSVDKNGAKTSNKAGLKIKPKSKTKS